MKRYYYKLHILWAALKPIFTGCVICVLYFNVTEYARKVVAEGGSFAAVLPYLWLTTAVLYAITVLLLTEYVSYLIIRCFVGWHRLNDYFVEVHYPLSKWRIIAQSVNKKHIKGMSCKRISHDLSKQAETLFENLEPHCIYIANTHKTMLKRLQQNPSIQILQVVLQHEGTLKNDQQKLLNRRCDKQCSKAKCASCIIKKAAEESRNFYFVKFKMF